MGKAARLVDLEGFKKRAQREIAPQPLSSEDIKGLLIKSSFDAYDFTIKQWIEGPYSHQIKLFLEYFSQTRTGLLEDRITDTTLINRFNNLKRAIKLHTCHQYTQPQTQEILKFVSKELVPGGFVSTCARSKPIAPIPVAADIVRFLFASDEYKQFHSRIRVQMAFAIQLMSCVGVRPGEIVESDAWYQTNEGLLYKDVKLVYWSEPKPEWRIEVKLRNRKGHREYKKHAPKAILPEIPSKRYMCPVTWFLSLAFADNVFEDIGSYHDLPSIQPIEGSVKFTARYRADALERPIMRGMYPNKSMSQNRIWTYDCFNTALKGVGQRAGYQENLSAYCFRRAFAQAVKGKFHPA
ncbi:hypothetical protein EJ07DRAFT_152290 [Lizonia empirigonia]|nr:hypothetical protein EJ07DRAFT_152290 [Lizonia empirigonia]